MSKPGSWAERKARRSNTIVSVVIPLAADLLEAHDELEEQLQAAKAYDALHNEPDTAPGVARQIEAVEAEMKATEEKFTFRAIGRGKYARLVAEHPPTDAQKEKAGEANTTAVYNEDTYPPALMAASCIRPAEIAGDIEEWTEIHESWGFGQVSRLWRACLAANNGVAETPKSVAASVVLEQNFSETN